MTVLDGGEHRHLNSVPRYRIEEVAQYKLNIEEGDIFSGEINLPDIDLEGTYTIDTGKYDETGDVVETDNIGIQDEKKKIKKY